MNKDKIKNTVNRIILEDTETYGGVDEHDVIVHGDMTDVSPEDIHQAILELKSEGVVVVKDYVLRSA